MKYQKSRALKKRIKRAQAWEMIMLKKAEEAGIEVTEEEIEARI